MTNKEKLKKVIKQDINLKNNYDKIIKKIENNNLQPKKWQFVMASICLLLIFTLGFVNLNKSSNQILNRDENYNSFEGSNYKNIIINKISKLDINNFKTSMEFIVQKDHNIDTSSSEIKKIDAIIPDDLKLNNIGSIYYKNKLNCYIEIYERREKSRNILITYAQENKPISKYDINETNSRFSFINENKLKIYQYQQKYIVRFNYDNVNYEIETNNITEQELKTLLSSIIK